MSVVYVCMCVVEDMESSSRDRFDRAVHCASQRAIHTAVSLIRLFLRSRIGRSNLAGAHQVTNVLLEELIVAVQLVVLLSDGFDALEDGKERVLKRLCLSVVGKVSHVSQGAVPHETSTKSLKTEGLGGKE